MGALTSSRPFFSAAAVALCVACSAPGASGGEAKSTLVANTPLRVHFQCINRAMIQVLQTRRERQSDPEYTPDTTGTNTSFADALTKLRDAQQKYADTGSEEDAREYSGLVWNSRMEAVKAMAYKIFPQDDDGDGNADGDFTSKDFEELDEAEKTRLFGGSITDKYPYSVFRAMKEFAEESGDLTCLNTFALPGALRKDDTLWHALKLETYVQQEEMQRALYNQFATERSSTGFENSVDQQLDGPDPIRLSPQDSARDRSHEGFMEQYQQHREKQAAMKDSNFDSGAFDWVKSLGSAMEAQFGAPFNDLLKGYMSGDQNAAAEEFNQFVNKEWVSINDAFAVLMSLIPRVECGSFQGGDPTVNPAKCVFQPGPLLNSCLAPAQGVATAGLYHVQWVSPEHALKYAVQFETCVNRADNDPTTN